ncbi:hypothetical protein M2262_002474 [Pseudomonas sp. BIGb0408]|uniref:Azurin n=1 Tax=Phytopseudomonas flavescens TaxID=29435 RepID=A0A7Y9XKD9_9GAMM|nr:MULTISPECIES: hypothetical protein [Pseudomonas]MCW2292424.1 hypothetical protein [Pseudomonas sp. BIGb0408]NYH73005.1 hypothetical protein [Pseudomonas flavescens]
MKISKLFGSIALAASMVAGAHAGTSVTIKVKNSTTADAQFTYEYFSGSVSPAPGSILPSGTSTFILTSGADTVSGMRFVYTSGSKQCRFAASHTVDPRTRVPTFNKTGTSIGTHDHYSLFAV